MDGKEPEHLIGWTTTEDGEHIPDAAPPRHFAEGLTFEQFRATNVTRCQRWHPDFLEGTDRSWTGADWSNAMCGEAGEAANVVKKLRRIDTGIAGAVDPERDRLIAMLADELGDVLAYLDLLGAYYGIDLGEAAARKFNKISEREGFPERML